MNETRHSVTEGCTDEWEIWPCQQSWHVDSDGEYVAENDDEYVVVAYRPQNYSARIIVPNVVDGKRIVGIANTTFTAIKADIMGSAAITKIREVIVSEGVRFLDADTFSYTTIQKIELPESLRLIGCACFSQSSVAEITVPRGVTHIGKRCFEGCWNLSQLTIEADIDVIEREMCASCSKLEAIELPDTIRTVSAYAFCGSGLKYLMLPESTATIEACAFWNCKNLQSISLPRKLSRIHDRAFDAPEENADLIMFVYPGSLGLMWAKTHGYTVSSAEI